MTGSLLIDIDARGVARLSLNRPEIHNAFNEGLIAELHDAFTTLGRDDRVRLILLTGEGQSFCAGADLDWMKRAATFSEDQNHRDAARLSAMLHALDSCPKPTVALVQGAALGGGSGLVACADIVIAVRDAKFGFTEVRLGLTPATISPYVIAKVGISAARRYFLTGERFTAEDAREIGLVHLTVGSAEDLEAAAERIVSQILSGAPGAQAAAKDLIRHVAKREITAELREETAGRIAARRASFEGREGLAAFFDRRAPVWAETEDKGKRRE
ncbi:MAG: enoyl-CoA hydratase/isomerase family protein [Rhodothalassiaceae bacterium]